MRTSCSATKPYRQRDLATTSLFDLGDNRLHGKPDIPARALPVHAEIIAFLERISYASAHSSRCASLARTASRPYRSRHVVGANPVVSVRGNLNRNEAHEVAETIVRALPARVRRKTMGVITLTGEHQARYVERLLLERLGRTRCSAERSSVATHTRFRATSASDVPEHGRRTDGQGNRLPALTADVYRRRFNVSASPRRDQMWLFHSVTQVDLNPDCLRWKLLEHFLHPEAGERARPRVVTERDRHPAFDSLFEQRVYLRIRNPGLLHPPAGARLTGTP